MTPTRRDVIKGLGALGVAPSLIGLTQKGRVIAGGFVADGSAVGHALRDGTTRYASASSRPRRRVKVAIVGGGIGGLSAAWQLDAAGMTDWVLLEMEGRTGGNARSADYRQAQRAPWGAHYLPVPSVDAVHVRQLMRDLGVLSASGEWNERMLCHTPQERLWQHGSWREGLDPLDAATPAERAQFARFTQRIAEWQASGMFTVPTAMGHALRTAADQGGSAAAARAKAVAALDGMTAHDWMQREGFTAPALRWWVEYGTRDDYGASLRQASAWAAVHYFAGRSSEDIGPLTWPEGNDWIAQQLTQRLQRRMGSTGRSRIQVGQPVWQLTRQGSTWIVDTATERLEADAVIWSAPLFVLPRVCAAVRLPVTLEYAPWVVANIVLHRAPAERGVPLAWDNVIYGSPSLGYVNAAHQLLGHTPATTVWTWYQALVDAPARDARQALQRNTWTSWRDHIIADLARAHADIAQCVARIDVMRWGHAMARPVPGTLSRVAALTQWIPAPHVFVAHADLSNLSLFEEAQWHGIHAATAALKVLA